MPATRCGLFLFRCDNYCMDVFFFNELQPPPVSYSFTTLKLVGQTKDYSNRHHMSNYFFFSDFSEIKVALAGRNSFAFKTRSERCDQMERFPVII